MSDTDLRQLVRLAETQGDARSWERAARAFERDARYLEAAEALARARELGADTRSSEEALEALPWAALAPRELRLGQAGAATDVAWSPDGQTLFTTMGEHFVLALEPATGARRTFASLPGIVGALAAVPSGRGLLIATLLQEAPSSRPVSRISLVVEDARRPEWSVEVPRPVRSLTVARHPRALVWTDYSHRVHVHGLDESGHPEPSEVWNGFRVWHTGAGELVRGIAATTAAAPASGGAPTLVPAQAELLSPADGLVLPVVVESVRQQDSARALVDASLLSLRFPTARAWLRFSSNERLADHATGAFATARALAVSPAGRNVAIASARDAALKIADLVTGVERTFALGAIHSMAWAPDGRSLAVATDLGLFLLESPPDLRSALESEWRAIQAQRGAGKSAFFARLDADPRVEVTDWLLRKLEPPYKDEPIVLDVLDAVHCLTRRRQPVDLARLARIRRLLPARRGFPGLADYREEVDWLSQVVESLGRGEKCLCKLSFPTPRHHGTLEREGPTASGGARYRCTVCGRRFTIEEEEDAREGSGRFTVTADPGESPSPPGA